MREDDKLKDRIGKENPFKVPENYFESLVPEIMDKLPEKDNTEVVEISLWERVKPWVYMAAMFCGLMFGVRVVVGDGHKAQSPSGGIALSASQDSVMNLQDEYIDNIVNNIMMDDYTLYLYLSDAESGTYE